MCWGVEVRTGLSLTSNGYFSWLRGMRVKYVLPPVLVGVAGSLVIGSQQAKIATIREEIGLLNDAIAQTKVQEGAAMASGPAVVEGTTSDSIDWAEAAGQFGMAQSGKIDMREMLALQKRLLAMDAEELIAATKEIEALDLPEREKMMLQSFLLGQLGEKDPELAVKSLFKKPKAGGETMAVVLSTVFGRWADKDVDAATRWLDEQIAAGAFKSTALDGKNENLNQYQSAVLNVLIPGNVQSATARLEAMTESERGDTLRGVTIQTFDEDALRNYKVLLEEMVSEDDRNEILEHHIDQIAFTADLEKLDRFLSVVDPGDEEKEGLVESAASSLAMRKSITKKVGVDDIEELRGWVKGQAPEEMEYITGVMLGSVRNLGGDADSDELVTWTLDYYDKSGDDKVIQGFLDEFAYGLDGEHKSKLISKIKDPEVRELYTD